jgi:hypothetical protein
MTPSAPFDAELTVAKGSPLFYGDALTTVDVQKLNR